MINKFADKLDHLTPDQVNEVMAICRSIHQGQRDP